MQIGTQIMLRRSIDRFPHFVAESGSTGTVLEFSAEYIRVKMDEPIEGCEEWDNEIVWSADGDDFDDFEQDIINMDTLLDKLTPDLFGGAA